jgi:hypothetical protein
VGWVSRKHRDGGMKWKQNKVCVAWLSGWVVRGRKEKRRARRGGWLLIRVTRLGVADSVPLRSGQVVGFTRSRRATCKPAVRTDEGSRRVPRSGSVHFSFSFSEKLHTLVFFFLLFSKFEHRETVGHVRSDSRSPPLTTHSFALRTSLANCGDHSTASASVR